MRLDLRSFDFLEIKIKVFKKCLMQKNVCVNNVYLVNVIDDTKFYHFVLEVLTWQVTCKLSVISIHICIFVI